jgi:hypothetical protein
MIVTIGDTAPDFEAYTTEGKVRFHQWIDDPWAEEPKPYIRVVPQPR